ncbi:hypothetical protein EV126DRAFT_421777 [Verticillium dahliae]|nr:hypothetical protein EV126DRAFT_421777 [Verticillium dahliae]
MEVHAPLCTDFILRHGVVEYRQVCLKSNPDKQPPDRHQSITPPTKPRRSASSWRTLLAAQCWNTTA